MNKCCKTFRLVSGRELRELEQQFNNNILSWNEQYALLPLNCNLNTNPIIPSCDSSLYLFTDLDQPVALFDTHELSTLNLSLFGDASLCFDSTSETLLLPLISQLLTIDTLQQVCVKGPSIQRNEWCYHGAPSLVVILSLGDKHINLYLHPQWVLKVLQSPMHQKKPKVDLQEALNSQIVLCQVELSPFTLTLKDSIHLQVGDVIQSDHPLSAPLFLKYQQQAICPVEPGKTQFHKSIQIVSSL